jgi:hypothetical protein
MRYIEWIEEHRIFPKFENSENMLAMFITSVTDQVAIIIETVRPVSGRKAVKKSFRTRQREQLCNSISKMLGNLKKYPAKLRSAESRIRHEIENALIRSFGKHCLEKHKQFRHNRVSQRGEKTLIFPWRDPAAYHDFVSAGKLFRAEVVNSLGEHARMPLPKKYEMCGYRPSPRKIVMPGGEKQEFKIRMVRCSDCGQKFSLLPSLIPREKHFSIDIIGQVIRDIVLFSQSISGGYDLYSLVMEKS